MVWSPIKIVVTTFWVSKALSTCGEMITSSSSAILITFEVRLLDGGKWSLTQSGPLQNPPLPNSQWPPIKGWKVKGNSPPNSKRVRKGAGAHLLEEYIESGWKCESSFSFFPFVNFLHLYLPEVACWVTGRVKLWQSSASHGRPLQFPSKLPQKRWCAACYVSRDGGRFVGEGGNFVPFCLKLKLKAWQQRDCEASRTWQHRVSLGLLVYILYREIKAKMYM